jgi:hypothetical protein
MMFCYIFVSSALILLFDCKIKCFDYCVFMCHKFDFQLYDYNFHTPRVGFKGLVVVVVVHPEWHFLFSRLEVLYSGYSCINCDCLTILFPFVNKIIVTSRWKICSYTCLYVFPVCFSMSPCSLSNVVLILFLMMWFANFCY